MYAVLIAGDTDPALLRRTVERVMLEALPASVVATFRSHSCERDDVAPIAASAGLGLVELNEDPLEPALRTTLTDLDRLSRTFRNWLRMADVTADLRLVSLLGDIMEHAAQQMESDGTGTPDGLMQSPTVPEMANTIDLTSRGLRDAFARNQLPSPVQWKILARSLAHAMVIQRNAETQLTRLAMTLGYADSQALSRAFHDRFGVTPTFARERLGWEWLALRWIDRHASVSNRHSTADSAHVAGVDGAHYP